MSVHATIISIGNELLIGRTVNSNAAFIGRKLFDIGIYPKKVLTIPDTPADITQSLQQALNESDIIITTGGLGPTNDDITKHVITEYFGGQLILNQRLLEEIKQKFASRGIPMADVNREQAMVPDNARVLDNHVGIAPGLYFQPNGKHVFILPGVPAEMKDIMETGVLPILKQHFGMIQPVKLVYRTVGIPESLLYEKLEPVIRQMTDAEFMFYPSYSGVDIKIFCKAQCDPENIHQKVFPLVEKYTFSTNEDENLENVIQSICLKNGFTVSAAESCTGGLLQNLLTNISGSSGYFMGGVVSYSNEAKVSLLNVSEKTLQEFGAVSEPVARQMAEGVKKLFGTTIGVGITGIAGPTGGTADKPVGLVYIAVSFKDKTVVKKYQFGTDRLVNKSRSAYSALRMIWTMMREFQ